MAEEQGFAQARARLDEIVVQVRKKDTSLEQSLDLLEEGVRLANQCTELVDHSEWRPSTDSQVEGAAAEETERLGEAASETDVAAVAEVVGDAESSDAAQDADSALGGTDAAGSAPGAAERAPHAPADEYDDIFADEE